MDAVKAFNAEMASIMDLKPPISRAKMMSITKAGMKAIKLYKHVVQIIEKFINKCNPELKVPGLYVVDSIIRQSRLQFGEDKDVFGPRFLKNIAGTFQSLYLCPPDDKEKILRVLNLWQKNSVFSMDIIQPLLDMASVPVVPPPDNGHEQMGSPVLAACVEPRTEPTMPSEPQKPVDTFPNDSTLAVVSRFLQSTQGMNIQQILQTLQQGGATQPSMFNATGMASDQENCSNTEERFHYDEGQAMEQHRLNETPGSSMNQQDPSQALQTHLFNHLPYQLPVNAQTEEQTPATMADETYRTGTIRESLAESGQSKRDGRDVRYGTRTRSRSPRRRSSSHSHSFSHHSRYHHSRSRSRERNRTSPRSHREDRKEVERRRKGLPPLKRQTLSVCSTTLWLGQLDKKIQQQDVSSLMEEFGQIESINMIPPRGCAYVAMVSRQDAYTALNKLSRTNARINHKPFKIAWAMNKGVSSRFKKYWEVELGVTYVPWEKLKESDIAALREGAVIDKETINPEWPALLAELSKLPEVNGGAPETEQDGAAIAQQAPGLSVVSSIMDSNILPAEHTTFNEETKNQNGSLSLNDSRPHFMSSMMPLPNLSPHLPHVDVPLHNLPSAELTSNSLSPINLPLHNLPPANLTLHNLPATDLPLQPLNNLHRTNLPPNNLAPQNLPLGDLPPRNSPPAKLPLTNLPRPRLSLPADLPPQDFPSLHFPAVNRPPAEVAWSNMPRPNFPRPNLYRHNLPRPGFPPPNLPRTSLPRGPPLRQRMPIQGQGNFLPKPMPLEHWEGEDFNDDWQEDGPIREPEWFEEEPPFRRGGWNRGGPRARAWFRN